MKPGVDDAPLDYDEICRRRDVAVSELLNEVDRLRKAKKFDQVEAALVAFLKHRGQKAEPWMYELLALALEANKRDVKQVQTAIGWAGYLSLQRKDVVGLVRAADMMMLRKMDEVQLPGDRAGSLVKTGALLDAAMASTPHLAAPILMSVQLARWQRDAGRMADSVGRLLSLGWPGMDEVWRLEAKRQYDGLVEDLKGAGLKAEAEALAGKWPGLAERDLVARLSWEGDARLELSVEEPLGARADHFSPRTVFGGALVVEPRGKRREAVYVCPKGFDGGYTFFVTVLYNDEKKPVGEAFLEITTHEGSERAKTERRRLVLDGAPPPLTVKLEGGRRKQVLPYQAPPQELVIDPGERGAGSAGDNSATAGDPLSKGEGGAKPRR